MWEKIHKDIKDYNQLRRRSEELRKSLKLRVDNYINKQSKDETTLYYITGVGEVTSDVVSAARVLGKEGTVLIDIPKSRGKEELLFFPEESHRGQKEEFEAPSLLMVSELWQIVSGRLHETAGNIRIFVHPSIAVLKSAKSKTGERIFDSHVVEEEVKNVFNC